MTELTPELREALEYGVAAVKYLVPEQIDDLRQDLAIRLLAKADSTRGKRSVNAFSRKIALELAKQIHRDDDRRRKQLRAIENSEPWIKTGEIWETTWYAPCEGAEEFAPLALPGARVMTVHERGGHLNTVEDSVLALIFRPSTRTRAANHRWNSAKDAIPRRVKKRPLKRISYTGRTSG